MYQDSGYWQAQAMLCIATHLKITELAMVIKRSMSMWLRSRT